MKPYSTKFLSLIVLLGVTGCGDGCVQRIRVRLKSLPSPSTQWKLTPEQQRIRELQNKYSRKKIEFLQSQRDAWKAYRANNSSRLRDWEGHERELRRDFFLKNKEGEIRRDYIKGFLSRKAEFKNNLKLEQDAFKQTQKIELEDYQKAMQEEKATELKLLSEPILDPMVIPSVLPSKQ